MKILNAFFLLALLRVFALAASSEDEIKFDKKLKNINKFFENFKKFSAEKFEEIAMFSLQYEGLDELFPVITSIPDRIPEILFADLLAGQLDKNNIIRVFRQYFDSSILLQLKVLLQMNPKIGKPISEISNSIKDALEYYSKMSFQILDLSPEILPVIDAVLVHSDPVSVHSDPVSVFMPVPIRPSASNRDTIRKDAPKLTLDLPTPDIPIRAAVRQSAPSVTSQQPIPTRASRLSLINPSTLEPSRDLDYAIGETVPSDDDDDFLDEEDEEEEADIKSPTSSSSLCVEAVVALSYGFDASHFLFPLACSYINVLTNSGLSKNLEIFLINPQSAFYEEYHHHFSMRGFNIMTPAFQEFCNFVAVNEMPITSPLYSGAKVSKTQILSTKRDTLIDLVRYHISRFIDSFETSQSNNTMIASIKTKFSIENDEIPEFLIQMARDAISRFLLLNENLSFVVELENSIKTECSDAISSFGLHYPNLSNYIAEQFMKLFEPYFGMIAKFTTIDYWKSQYTESLSSIKTTYSQDSMRSQFSTPDSGRKSVTIMEESNQTRIIDDHFSIELLRGPVALRRVASFNSSLDRINSSSGNRFDNYDRELGWLSQISPQKQYSPKPATAVPAFAEVKQEPVLKYKANEIPDFPFDDPLTAVKESCYIASTVDYFVERGDNSCFMLDERIVTLKEGIRELVHDSFTSEVANSLEEILSSSMNSVFESLKTLNK